MQVDRVFWSFPGRVSLLFLFPCLLLWKQELYDLLGAGLVVEEKIQLICIERQSESIPGRIVFDQQGNYIQVVPRRVFCGTCMGPANLEG